MKLNSENIEAYLLQYAENELDEATRAEVEAFLAENPEYREMLEAYDPDFRLPVPPTPAYPNKKALQKTVPMPVWWINTRRAAAIVLLLLVSAAVWRFAGQRNGKQPYVAGNSTVIIDTTGKLPVPPVQETPSLRTSTGSETVAANHAKPHQKEAETAGTDIPAVEPETASPILAETMSEHDIATVEQPTNATTEPKFIYTDKMVWFEPEATDSVREEADTVRFRLLHRLWKNNTTPEQQENAKKLLESGIENYQKIKNLSQKIFLAVNQ